MQDCIFCKIVKGEISAQKLFEDNDVVAFLDTKPFTKGHCLVIPKVHAENIFDIHEDSLKKVMAAAKNISATMKENPGLVGINLVNNNGLGAGQRVFHFHVHVIPRYEEQEKEKIAEMMGL